VAQAVGSSANMAATSVNLAIGDGSSSSQKEPKSAACQRPLSTRCGHRPRPFRGSRRRFAGA
jgi:hypothetical protein